MFSTKDISYLQARGISRQLAELQIENFRRGFPFTRLDRPAVKGDGILVYSLDQIDELVHLYDQLSRNRKIIKFVPASGAASRMFKNLYDFLDKANSVNQAEIMNMDRGSNSVYAFITQIRQFAFYEELKQTFQQNKISLDEKIAARDYLPVIEAVVRQPGLNYGNLPKGLLNFHKYPETSRKAFEEHLVEAAMYATSQDNVAYVHFTVSPEHMEQFVKLVGEVKNHYEQLFRVTFDINFSTQSPATDTIAVDLNNDPLRDESGNLIFRPGGHGALIENLNNLNGDVIFIKNIDNVVPDRLKDETIRYKKALGGLMLSLQQETFACLETLTRGNPGTSILEEIREFAQSKLDINFPASFDQYSDTEKIEFLQQRLNRPIRICGMVKNEGEPGGGPFWVKQTNGNVSLQIVEASQIDISDPGQQRILNASTHFNPVDLVCGTKDFRGQKFDLYHYIDPETGFISVKSKGGTSVKAQELPGLWNGAMAEWITLFVEVPIITFNPVKTVNDLLRPQHQPHE